MINHNIAGGSMIAGDRVCEIKEIEIVIIKSIS